MKTTNALLLTALTISLSSATMAQKTDGTTRSLVNAELEFSAALAKDGASKAFIAYAADNALIFRPNPVNAKTFYAKPDNDKNLSWKPVFAKMSKSGDWGFTTGPYVYSNGTEKAYGEYLSIWQANNGKWKLAMDLGITHNKPLKAVTQEFPEPKGNYRPKLYGEKEFALGREIISNTETTLNATLKSYGPAALSGFLNDDARLLFPGNEPIIGKTNILAFNNTMMSQLNLKTTAADRTLSGDLAYTYGIATLDYKADLRESFNYVFIWERQPDNNWNIILQIFVPAER